MGETRSTDAGGINDIGLLPRDINNLGTFDRSPQCRERFYTRSVLQERNDHVARVPPGFVRKRISVHKRLPVLYHANKKIRIQSEARFGLCFEQAFQITSASRLSTEYD